MRRARPAALVALALLNVLTLVAGVAAVAVAPARVLGEPHVVQREPLDAPRVLAPSGPSGTSAPDGARGFAAAEALREAMSAAVLGSGAAAVVVNPASGRVLFRQRGKQPVTPASTTKLLTATAALAALGPDARLTTKVVRGRRPGSIVLVGGGDPTLASPEASHAYPKPAQLGRLARETARTLRRAGTTTVRLSYDTSVFTGPALARSWEPDYVEQGYVAPITGLSVDEGRVRPGESKRVSDPARAAAEAFAALLEGQGVTVRGPPREELAPEGSQRLASVRSPALSALVERMLTTSDNMLAEALGRHVALAVGKPAAFSGATAAIEQVVAGLGVPTRDVKLYDCSGLSYDNKLTGRALTRVLFLAATADHPGLRSVLTGLPVAGYSGTLAQRYENGRAARAGGFVRAKTGTLNGVSTLAGVAYRPDGGMLIFAFLADHVPRGRVLAARAVLDRMATVLANRPP